MPAIAPFRVGDWTVEPDLDRISRGGQRIHLRPQVMRVLAYLSERQGEVVRSDALMHDLWSGKIVSDATLYNCVAELRHVLGEGGDGLDAIQTVPKKGYRLRLPVSYTDVPESQGRLEGPPQTASGNFRRWIWLSLAGLVLAASATLIIGRQSAEPDEAVSLAVLPFVAMSNGPDDEYFADGLSEEILNSLSRLTGLRVISRTSSFFFKGKDVDIATIARRLDARWVLEGSLRRWDDQVRVTAQLIDTRSRTHVWSDSYDRDLSAVNLFQVQSEIARAVTDQLRSTLTEADERRLQQPPTENTEAYTAYLLGRERLRDRKVGELNDAVDRFAHAIELDPQFAHAYAGLADACWLLYGFSGGHVNEHCPASAEEGVRADKIDIEPLVRKALSIDDGVGEAWVTLGLVLRRKAHVRGGGPDVMYLIREAQAAFKKGIELSPSFSQAYAWYAFSLQYIYAYDDPPNGWLTAWENHHWQSVIERGLEIDPLSLSLHQMKTKYPRNSSTREEAVAHASKMIEIAPDSPQGYAAMADIQSYAYGRLDEAIPWLKKAASRDRENSTLLSEIGNLYCALGDAEMAMAYLEHARQLAPPDVRPSYEFRGEICQRLLSGEIRSGRLKDILEKAQGPDAAWRIQTLAMIDTRTGRPENALARYREIVPDACFDDSVDDLLLCPFQMMTVMEAAGDYQRAREMAEKRLRPIEMWFERYPHYSASLFYAEGLSVLGRFDEALDVLETLVDEDWLNWTYLGPPFALETNITFDNMRDYPRFQALVARVKAKLSEQLQNVREMERRGELPTLEAVNAVIASQRERDRSQPGSTGTIPWSR
ncbi:winged helix-turn-helix domain-containing protein [Lentisalinibacter salinarum]|uniref:winged helix-turn-helix domain-containing protein n=1 Tax=Lentisalinibacter salinarum TaxID=2992239 RepID=UPI00386E308C